MGKLHDFRAPMPSLVHFDYTRPHPSANLPWKKVRIARRSAFRLA